MSSIAGGLSSALARVVFPILFSPERRGAAYNLIHWMLTFSSAHRDFDFATMFREIFAACSGAVSEQHIQLLSSFFVFTIMCSASSLAVSDSVMKSEPHRRRFRRWLDRIAMFQHDVVKFCRRAPTGSERGLLYRLLFLDDESAYRLTTGGRPNAAELRQYQFITRMGILRVDTLQDLLSLANVEDKLSRVDALQIVESLLMRDMTFRSQFASTGSNNPSFDLTMAQGVVDGVVALTIYTPCDVKLAHKIAVASLYWRSILVILLLSCGHPSTIGRYAYRHVGVL